MINKIYAIAKQNLREGLYYRFDLLLYIFNFIVEITVYVFIWLAIYNKRKSNSRYEFRTNNNLLCFSCIS